MVFETVSKNQKEARDGPAVRSHCCSPRGHRLSSQHRELTTACPSRSGGCEAFLRQHGPHTHTQTHMHKHEMNTYILTLAGPTMSTPRGQRVVSHITHHLPGCTGSLHGLPRFIFLFQIFLKLYECLDLRKKMYIQITL